MKSDSEDKELETGTGEFVKADDAAEKEEQLPDEIGDVKVADEVISIVAGLAAQEVNGVIGMSGSFAEGLNEFLGKKSFAKGVRITVDGHVVTAAVYVNVEYGKEEGTLGVFEEAEFGSLAEIAVWIFGTGMQSAG